MKISKGITYGLKFSVHEINQIYEIVPEIANSETNNNFREFIISLVFFIRDLKARISSLENNLNADPDIQQYQQQINTLTEENKLFTSKISDLENQIFELQNKPVDPPAPQPDPIIQTPDTNQINIPFQPYEIEILDLFAKGETKRLNRQIEISEMLHELTINVILRGPYDTVKQHLQPSQMREIINRHKAQQ